jgi:hypothetical protein
MVLKVISIYGQPYGFQGQTFQGQLCGSRSNVCPTGPILLIFSLDHSGIISWNNTFSHKFYRTKIKTFLKIFRTDTVLLLAFFLLQIRCCWKYICVIARQIKYQISQCTESEITSLFALNAHHMWFYILHFSSYTATTFWSEEQILRNLKFCLGF